MATKDKKVKIYKEQQQAKQQTIQQSSKNAIEMHCFNVLRKK